MTPAARVQASIEILDRILDGTPAEKALTGWARSSRFAGSKDRAAIRDHVFDALRQWNSAAALGGASTGRALMIGLLRLQNVGLADVFSGATYAPATLIKGEDTVEVSQLPHDVPAWVLEKLEASLGAKTEQTLRDLRQRAPITLRVNLSKLSRTEAQRQLMADGIETEMMDLANGALCVTAGARRIRQSALYLDGVIELQDAASQAMVEALPISEGMKILDYCAGGGGKTLAMAGHVDGRFFAYDIAPHRMVDLPARAERAGVQVTLTDAPVDSAPYDLVLCDAPCSGSGTWRRTPDAKWRFTPERLGELIETQAEILTTAKNLVATGGALAYATCSFLKEENMDQIQAFLSRHKDWTLEWSHQYGFEEGGDGFFGAVLRKS
ncbi:RsmB/NOP family class I SAM-dependent RNA methyltransferase [Shimia sp.]|uniref:RsmB/NOP family class I SAM-dependent RNA methyltransferase n=1 Tax=Shimia sp. TaxID=1954381 RepID=UPI003B8E0EB3